MNSSLLRIFVAALCSHIHRDARSLAQRVCSMHEAQPHSKWENMSVHVRGDELAVLTHSRKLWNKYFVATGVQLTGAESTRMFVTWKPSMDQRMNELGEHCLYYAIPIRRTGAHSIRPAYTEQLFPFHLREQCVSPNLLLFGEMVSLELRSIFGNQFEFRFILKECKVSRCQRPIDYIQSFNCVQKLISTE